MKVKNWRIIANMDKDLISFMIGWLSSIALTILLCVFFFDRVFYMIPKSDWKCTGAYIIDDDPSNTECNVYKLKKENDDV